MVTEQNELLIEIMVKRTIGPGFISFVQNILVFCDRPYGAQWWLYIRSPDPLIIYSTNYANGIVLLSL